MTELLFYSTQLNTISGLVPRPQYLGARSIGFWSRGTSRRSWVQITSLINSIEKRVRPKDENKLNIVINKRWGGRFRRNCMTFQFVLQSSWQPYFFWRIFDRKLNFSCLDAFSVSIPWLTRWVNLFVPLGTSAANFNTKQRVILTLVCDSPSLSKTYQGRCLKFK